MVGLRGVRGVLGAAANSTNGVARMYRSTLVRIAPGRTAPLLWNEGQTERASRI